MRTTALLALVAHACGHGAMTFPKPRNSLDGALPPWKDWAYPCDDAHEGDMCKITFCEDGKDCQGSCPISAHSGVKNQLNASNGQSCYWFSNGCTLGCDDCDGTNNHVGHGMQRFLYKGMDAATVIKKNLTIEAWNPAPGDMVLNPTTTKDLKITSNCGRTAKASVCDPRLRTVNTQAECGGPDDFYYYSPWRKPGAAPVIDACGVAGGRFPGQGTGGAGAQFQNTTAAKQGDVGSKLPPMASQATWTAGSTGEVGYTVMAHHGGGYAYRLARADGPLTEEAFRKIPLDFSGPSALRWDGDKSGQLEFDATQRGWETHEGTVPAGSYWRKHPIPTVLWEREGPSFEPVCEESDACKAAASAQHGPQGVCKCSGHSNGGPLLPNLEIVDELSVPAGLAPGAYVLQWRWDCEETDQVWLSCSDVTIAAAS
jgi:hypothetical protein